MSIVIERARPAAWTTERWLEYYRGNRELRRPIPWEEGAGLTADELATVGRSLQSWQRGESSEGSHLRAVADRHALAAGDPTFRDVAELFIREEQRHSALMGRFLTLAGVGTLEADWGDRLFRRLRHGSRDLAGWIAPVVVAEVLAVPYFDALRRATGSPTLRAICGQILADEAVHIRFQCETLARLFRGRPASYRRRMAWWQGAIFVGAVATVWLGHRRVLRAGGYGWGRFWSSSRKAMGRAWDLMRPERYEWLE